MSITITMPRLSDTMETGTIIKWNVKEGDRVSAGDVIADVETDKATMEMAAYDDGTIAKIEVPEGKPVSVGTVIAVLAEKGENTKDASPAAMKQSAAAAPKIAAPAKAEPVRTSAPALVASAGRAATEVVSPAEPPRAQSASTSSARAEGDSGRVRVSPVARLLAEEHDIDLASIEGTGPGGRIIKRDVLQAIEAADETAAAVPKTSKGEERAATLHQRSEETPLATRVNVAATASSSAMGAPGGMTERSIQLSGMRQTIARRLVESKTTIPHYQVTATFNMDPLLALRSQLNEQLESQGVKLSVNDFLVRCCALAMYRHPEFNASWGGDHIAIHGEINIGIAISIPIERGGGLVVGSIRNADQKSLRVISFESRNLAEKARTRGLSVEDMSDTTFTISNLGMFGVDNFTAIINPPNSAILAVGAAIEKPVVRNHQLTIGHEMNATLSCDHRVIDGAMAAQYMQTLRQLMESPGTLIV